MWFEDELEQKKWIDEELKKNNNGYEPRECERINIIEIKKITDITDKVKAVVRKDVSQVFEVLVLTEYKDFVCDRKLGVGLEQLLKLARNDYYYDDPLSDFADDNTRRVFMEKFYNKE